MPAIIIRNVGLNGSQFLAADRIMRARKLRGGPGISGITQPTTPSSETISPRIITEVVIMPASNEA
jgi:hypothetical protein